MYEYIAITRSDAQKCWQNLHFVLPSVPQIHIYPTVCRPRYKGAIVAMRFVFPLFIKVGIACSFFSWKSFILKRNRTVKNVVHLKRFLFAFVFISIPPSALLSFIINNRLMCACKTWQILCVLHSYIIYN